jgi:hypothetical protein
MIEQSLPAPGDYAWEYLAFRWNLQFDKITLDTAHANNNSKIFSTEIALDRLWRFTDGRLESWSLPSLTLVSSLMFPFTVKTNRSPSLVNGGDGWLYIFAITDTGILMTRTQDGVTFAAATEIVADDKVVRVAAASKTRVHFVRKLPGGVRQLCCMEYPPGATSWNEIGSDVYWQYQIQSISAAPLPDGSGDSVVIVAQTPGLVSVKYKDGAITKSMNPAGGVMAFQYKNRIWSDHFNVDVLDRLTKRNSRRFAHVTLINGTLHLSVYGIDGDDYNANPMYRHYTSRDGRFWSMGHALPLPVPDDFGIKGLRLLYHGDYIYGVQPRFLYRSLSTLQTGYAAAGTHSDISDDVVSANLSQQEGSTLSLTLDNGSGEYDSHPIINGENTIALIQSHGYWTESAGVWSRAVIQTGIFEVDALQHQYEPSKQMLSLTARDRFAWMSDRSASEQAIYWEGQAVGADSFEDDPNTKSGGMGHSAIQTGAWNAGKKKLMLTTPNEEGIVFSTFDPYIWNGQHQANFKLALVNNNEYAGLVFRAVDKDNLWLLFYDQATDSLVLAKREGGVQTTIYQHYNMGWASEIKKRWLRVDFRYARIKAYYSADGINWTEAFVQVVGANPDIGTSGIAVMDKGYVGFIGKGYAAPPPVEPIALPAPPIVWTVPDSDEEWPYEAGQSSGGAVDSSGFNNLYALFWTTAGDLLFTDSFTYSTPAWRKITLGSDEVVRSAAWDPASPFITSGASAGALSILAVTTTSTQVKVWRVPNALDLLTVPALLSTYTSTLIEDANIHVSSNGQTIMAVVKREKSRVAFFSLNGGTTWDSTVLSSWTTEARPGQLFSLLISDTLLLFEQAIDTPADFITKRGLAYRVVNGSFATNSSIAVKDEAGGVRNAMSPIFGTRGGEDDAYVGFLKYSPVLFANFEHKSGMYNEGWNDACAYYYNTSASAPVGVDPFFAVGMKGTAGLPVGASASGASYHHSGGAVSFEREFIIGYPDPPPKLVQPASTSFNLIVGWLESYTVTGTLTWRLRVKFTDGTEWKATKTAQLYQSATLSMPIGGMPAKRVKKIIVDVSGSTNLPCVVVIPDIMFRASEDGTAAWKLWRVKNFDSSTPEWIKISPKFDPEDEGDEPAPHSEIISVSASPADHKRLVVVVRNGDGDRTGVFMSLDKGDTWKYFGDNDELYGAILARGDRVVGFGDEYIEEMSTRSGNLFTSIDTALRSDIVRGFIVL